MFMPAAKGSARTPLGPILNYCSFTFIFQPTAGKSQLKFNQALKRNFLVSSNAALPVKTVPVENWSSDQPVQTQIRKISQSKRHKNKLFCDLFSMQQGFQMVKNYLFMFEQNYRCQGKLIIELPLLSVFCIEKCLKINKVHGASYV